MILFKKLCDDCKRIKTAKQLNNTKEFFAIYEDIKKLIENGNYEYVGGNIPTETIKYLPQDGLWYRVKCKSCGTFFTLWYDTFGEKGHFKKGKYTLCPTSKASFV